MNNKKIYTVPETLRETFLELAKIQKEIINRELRNKKPADKRMWEHKRRLIAKIRSFN